jgi:hypothetical protein
LGFSDENAPGGYYLVGVFFKGCEIFSEIFKGYENNPENIKGSENFPF